jgi:hypothetical protein
MTLLDAPKFDAVRDRRIRIITYSSLGSLLVLFVAFWLAAGHPVDWPWYWLNHLRARHTANEFLTAVEKDDLPKAYGIWMHDPNWQQHPDKYSAYSFNRFHDDWSRTSPDNEYGIIQSHKIVVAHQYGNIVLMAILINGRKSNALNLVYDPKTHTLNFSPPDMQINPEFYQ